MARALSSQASFDAQQPIGPWLKRMLLRLFLDHRSRVMASPEGQTPSAFEDSVAASEEAGRASELKQQAEGLLASLDEPERTILDRFHRHGESIFQIARDLGMPTGTVKSHLHRARHRLREQARADNPIPGDPS